MSKMIFVNLPVTDLAASMRFYEAVGFTNDPQFTNDKAAAMSWLGWSSGWCGQYPAKMS